MHQPQDGRWRQPPYPYAPRFRPPHRPRSRIWIAYLAAGVFAVTATVFALAPRSADVGQIDSDPAAAFDGASAIDLAYTYIAPDGSEINGWFSVTDDGYAVGTVDDRLGGSAELHVTPESSAVLGDQDWWARRSPAQAGELEGTWVRPDEGTAFPLDVSGGLAPEAVADLIRAIDAEGTEVDTPAAGTITTTWQDWTLVRTDTVPSEVLSLAGPLDSDLIGRPAATSGSYGTETADWEGGEDVTVTPALAGAPGWMRLVPGPAGPQTGELVRSTAQETNSGETTADTGGEEPEPPPAQSNVEPVWPAFQATINATDCWSSTCSWSATVENVGTGPGEALVTASVTPGMSPVNQDLGTIQPGSSASTTTMSFGNPAPTPAPGQTTEITVAYAVIVYSPQLGGGDQGKYMDLLDKLGGQAKQPALDRILGKVAPVLASGLVDTLSRMIDSGIDPDAALDAADAATEAAPAEGEYADLPTLNRLAQAGDRFRGWDALADVLAASDPALLAAYQPALEAAAAALADPAAPTVTLLPNEQGTVSDAVLLSDFPEPEPTRCTGIVSVPDADLAAAAERAAANASGTGEDCTVYTRLIVPNTNRHLWNAAAPALQPELRSIAEQSCTGGDPQIANVTVATGRGTYEWPGASLCNSLIRPTMDEIIEHLNGFGLPEEYLADMEAKGLITTDATGAITAVNWKDPDKPCSPWVTHGGATEMTASSPGYSDGPRAHYGAAYLCAPLNKGTAAGNQVLWDWPTAASNAHAKDNQSLFHRCHLVANDLGGLGATDADVGNLVTCWRNTNFTMKESEQAAKRAVKTRAKEHLFYLAVPQYNGPDGELSGIRITVVGDQGYWDDTCYSNEPLATTVLFAAC